jgi:hypothetical protein
MFLIKSSGNTATPTVLQQVAMQNAAWANGTTSIKNISPREMFDTLKESVGKVYDEQNLAGTHSVVTDEGTLTLTVTNTANQFSITITMI